MAVGSGVADAFHCLSSSCQWYPLEWLVDVQYFDLLQCPCIHAQTLDFGDVGAQFAMQCSATHAKKDAQLNTIGPSAFGVGEVCTKDRR